MRTCKQTCSELMLHLKVPDLCFPFGGANTAEGNMNAHVLKVGHFNHAQRLSTLPFLKLSNP